MKRLQKSKLDMLQGLLKFIVRGDYSPQAKRHAKGLLIALLDV